MRITSWETADAALARLATLERREQRAEGAGKARMQKIRERLAGVLKPLRNEWKRLQNQLEKWTFGHADELRERTRVLAHGAVRLYKTPTAIVLDQDEEAVIKALKRRGLLGCIRVKEEVDKVALRELSDQLLADIGAHRESHDEFQYQLSGEAEWR